MQRNTILSHQAATVFRTTDRERLISQLSQRGWTRVAARGGREAARLKRHESVISIAVTGSVVGSDDRAGKALALLLYLPGDRRHER
jgi:hypothetical protein